MQRWISISEESSVDRDGLATISRWLTTHSQFSIDTDIESYAGVLSAKNDYENSSGTAIGSSLTLNKLQWLRRIDAAAYRFNDATQWEGGAQFSFLNERIELQLQHNVFLWWRELSAQKIVVNSSVPIGGMAIELNWQHFSVSDGNAVQDTTIRLNLNDFLTPPAPLHWRIGFHRRSAKFNDPDYWSPNTDESTLELGAGLAWKKSRWHFSLFAQRNFALNTTTDPSWSVDSTIVAILNEKLSLTVCYASGNGRPQRDAFWWQSISATVRSNF